MGVCGLCRSTPNLKDVSVDFIIYNSRLSFTHQRVLFMSIIGASKHFSLSAKSLQLWAVDLGVG